MGFFDGMTDGIFKTDRRGRHIFCPWGVLGRGYIIPSDIQKNALRSDIRNSILIALVIAAAVAWRRPLYAVIVALAYGVWYCTRVRLWTRGLSQYDEKLWLLESYRNAAASHSLPKLIVLEILALTFLAFGIFEIMDNAHFGAFTATGIAGLASVIIAHKIYIKIKISRSSTWQA